MRCRFITVATLALCVSCSGKSAPRSRTEDTPNASRSGRASSAPVDSVSAQPPWFAEAESVLRRTVALWIPGASLRPTTSNDLRECDEEGSDNLPMYMIIATARPLAHDTIQSGTTDFGNVPFKYTDFRVEVTSVARLTPTESLPPEAIPDSVRQTTDPYDATVSPRVDTLQITVLDYGAAPKRWSVCGLYGHVDGIESPFWGIVRDASAGIRIIRWTPAGTSWVQVRQLGDSIRRSSP